MHLTERDMSLLKSQVVWLLALMSAFISAVQCPKLLVLEPSWSMAWLMHWEQILRMWPWTVRLSARRNLISAFLSTCGRVVASVHVVLGSAPIPPEILADGPPPDEPMGDGSEPDPFYLETDTEVEDLGSPSSSIASTPPRPSQPLQVRSYGDCVRITEGGIAWGPVPRGADFFGRFNQG